MTQIGDFINFKCVAVIDSELVVIDFGCEVQFARFVRMQDNQSTATERILLKLAALFLTFPWIQHRTTDKWLHKL